jgi:hypothetical protein
MRDFPTAVINELLHSTDTQGTISSTLHPYFVNPAAAHNIEAAGIQRALQACTALQKA